MSEGVDIAALRVERDAGVLLDIPVLALDAGSVTVVTGPTDSGKTVLAGVLCGAMAASAGSIHVGGRAVTGNPSARRRQGVAATVGNGGRIAGCTVAEALAIAGRARATPALERFPALRGRARVRAELLSGGEQQMLQVACAWAGSPRLLVLDAPATGLADSAVAAVRELAAEVAGDGGTVLWLDQSEAHAPGRARWHLRAGRISPAPGAE